MKPAPFVLIWLCYSNLEYAACFWSNSFEVQTSYQNKNIHISRAAKICHRIEGFVPRGWKIKDTVTGNLNNDKAADAVIILEYRHKVVEHSDETHPRILMIAFKAGDHYILKLQHNAFILP